MASPQARLFFDRVAPDRAPGAILRAGWIRDSTGTPWRRLDDFAVVLLLRGGGTYLLPGGRVVPVRAGDVLVVLPGVPHAYGPAPGGEWDEVFAVFGGPVFDLWRRPGLLDEERPVHRATDIAGWETELRSLLASAGRATSAGEELSTLCRFLQLLTDLSTADQPTTWAGRAGRRLGEDLGAPLDLRAVAAEFGLTYDGFRKRFRRETGVAPAAYRAELRVAAARRLLRTTAMSNRQVAAALGYADEHHFSRRFSRATGTTPSATRASTGGPGTPRAATPGC